MSYNVIYIIFVLSPFPSSGSVGKIIGASVLFVGGGVGGTVLYASYDPRFRENVEKAIPYSDKLFEMALGPAPYSVPMPKKPVSISHSLPPYTLHFSLFRGRSALSFQILISLVMH